MAAPDDRSRPTRETRNMSENENTATGADQGARRPALHRDSRSKMIAGVCGGLGRHFDVDPVVFRVLFTVLTFFGGIGLLTYAAAWLLVPADGETEAEAHKLLAGRYSVVGVAVTAVLVLGFVSMTITLSEGFGSSIPPLAVAAVIIAVLAWRDGNRPPAPPGQTRHAPTGGGPTSSGEQPQPWWQRPVQAYPAPGFEQPRTGAQAPNPDRPAGTEPGNGADAGRSPADLAEGEPGTWSTPQTAATYPPAAPPPRRRIGGLLAANLLVVLGVLGVLAMAGAIRIGWTAGLALTVMAVGAGMTVAGMFGRARWPIAVGLVLAVPLIAANALQVPLRGETGDVTWAPSSATAVASTYELAGGRGRLDLSALDPTGGTVHAKAWVVAGRLLVTVPRDVALKVTGHLGAGEFNAPDGTRETGLDLTKTYDFPSAGTSKGTIVLDLKVGAGNLEVDRA
jgi:phage shock protein PspC (stress-responsive transcriptional regulator)